MTEQRPKNYPYSRKWNVTSTMKILPLKSIGAKENNICVEFRITFAVINHFYPYSFITSTKRHIERKQPHARKQVRPSTLNTRKRFRFRPRKGISWESHLLIKLDDTTLQLTAQDSLRIKSMVISKQQTSSQRFFVINRIDNLLLLLWNNLWYISRRPSFLNIMSFLKVNWSEGYV